MPAGGRRGNVRRSPTNISEISILFHFIFFVSSFPLPDTSVTIVIVVESSRVGRRRWHDSIHTAGSSLGSRQTRYGSFYITIMGTHVPG